MNEKHATTLLFIGDSVTDCNRRQEGEWGLGQGYVRMLAEDPTAIGTPPVRVINRGISGNRVRDLQSRWSTDSLQLRPDVLSILVGVNDMWRRYDSNDPTSAAEFESGYRDILRQSRDSGVRDIVLIEPFLLPINDEQLGWRADLDEKIDVVHRLAAEFGTVLVPADRILTQHARESSAAELADDGVHPTAAGHRVLADAWQTHVAALAA